MQPTRSKKRLFILIGVAVVIVVALTAMVIVKKREKPIEITTDKAFRKSITQLVTATGKIQPEVEVKIAPETSGAIFTSTSGWILPVAVTSCVIDLRKALSVVISIGFSRFFTITIAVRATTITTATPIRMNSRFFERVGCIADHYERTSKGRVSTPLS